MVIALAMAMAMVMVMMSHGVGDGDGDCDADDDDHGESVYLDNCIRSDDNEEEEEEEEDEDDLPMYSAPGPTHTWTKGKKQQPSVMRTREILDKFSRNVEQEHKLLSYAFIVKAPTHTH